MTAMLRTAALGPAPGLRWVQDARSVTAIQADGRNVVLRGTEATIWAWMAATATQPQLVEFVAELMGTDLEQSTSVLGTLLARWQEEGLLVPIPVPGGGGTRG